MIPLIHLKDERFNNPQIARGRSVASSKTLNADRSTLIYRCQLLDIATKVSFKMFLLLLALLLSTVYAQSSCPSSIQANTSPAAMAGFEWDIISVNLSTPRDITFDSRGRLLILEAGSGITALTLSNDSCSVVSTDGNTLYASSNNSAWAWDYNVDGPNISNPRIIVTGMGGTTHSTRTLHIPPLHPNLLVVSRGSDGNIDASAADIASGHSQVKVFDLNHVPSGGYDYTSEGAVLGFGVRNEVGVTSDLNGRIWGVMNSADDLTRNGTDISKDNPAEELHYCTSLFPSCFFVLYLRDTNGV